MKTLFFRPAHHDDFTLIAHWPQSRDELYYFAPRAPWPLCAGTLRQIANERLLATVAECDGVAVGYANVYRQQAGGYAVGNLVVSPDMRGAGIASALMAQMEAQLRGRGETTLHVACFNQNTAALRLYHQRGYRPQSLEQREGPSGEPVILIQLLKTLGTQT